MFEDCRFGIGLSNTVRRALGMGRFVDTTVLPGRVLWGLLESSMPTTPRPLLLAGLGQSLCGETA